MSAELSTISTPCSISSPHWTHYLPITGFSSPVAPNVQSCNVFHSIQWAQSRISMTNNMNCQRKTMSFVSSKSVFGLWFPTILTRFGRRPPPKLGSLRGCRRDFSSWPRFGVRRIESAPSIGLRPRKVFDVVNDEARGTPAKKLEDELEAEYLRIIDWVYPSRRADLGVTVELYRRIVGTFVSLIEPLDLVALSRLLGKEVADVRSALRPLSSVFYVDTDSSVPIRCYHATFREFLLTIPTCSTEFHRNFLFDGPQHHLMLRLCVERLLEELSVGMCAETNDYNSLDEIPDFDVKVRAILPSHLRYCCLHWNDHLLTTSKTEYEAVEATLGRLLGSCLLKWIEAMSLLKETKEVIPILVRTKNRSRSSVRCWFSMREYHFHLRFSLVEHVGGTNTNRTACTRSPSDAYRVHDPNPRQPSTHVLFCSSANVSHLPPSAAILHAG